MEIDAYNVGHDLSWGQTTFRKVAKAQLNQNDRMADPEVQDAADQLDREAAMGEVTCPEAGEEALVCSELAVDGLVDPAGGSTELDSAASNAYETMGAGSR